MIIKPGFMEHWKTRRLIRVLGHEGIAYLLRLWSFCETNRQWVLKLDEWKLADIVAYPEDKDAEVLWKAFTDLEAAWLDPDEVEGVWVVHGWEEMNANLVRSWKGGEARKKGTGKPEAQAKPKAKGKLEGSLEEAKGKLEGSLREASRVEKSRVRTSPTSPKGEGVFSDAARRLLCGALGRSEAVFSEKEKRAALKAGADGVIEDSRVALVAGFYEAARTGELDRKRYHPRSDLLRVLLNFSGEEDKARAWAEESGFVAVVPGVNGKKDHGGRPPAKQVEAALLALGYRESVPWEELGPGDRAAVNGWIRKNRRKNE